MSEVDAILLVAVGGGPDRGDWVGSVSRQGQVGVAAVHLAFSGSQSESVHRLVIVSASPSFSGATFGGEVANGRVDADLPSFLIGTTGKTLKFGKVATRS